MIRRSSVDLATGRAGAERLRRAASASPAAAPCSASATSTVRLPSVRSSPAGLPVDLRVAEHAEQVVAELERLARAAARTAVSASSVAASAPASAAPTCSGRSMEYFADL